ncbi:hypothetical protein CKAN_02553500 [Cinnamomum micranthum f. kanehirae]|uniref:Uncharacterized protein n=1 Tax=Cinnamomum micranthum f. kanehirae TaxID=337451 RepID=A0A443PZF6_9MAGN|nr:hypothetical protein CKAN_02553500 [Cinnamomum micranthum f. kanehirae]
MRAANVTANVTVRASPSTSLLFPKLLSAHVIVSKISFSVYFPSSPISPQPPAAFSLPLLLPSPAALSLLPTPSFSLPLPATALSPSPSLSFSMSLSLPLFPSPFCRFARHPLSLSLSLSPSDGATGGDGGGWARGSGGGGSAQHRSLDPTQMERKQLDSSTPLKLPLRISLLLPNAVLEMTSPVRFWNSGHTSNSQDPSEPIDSSHLKMPFGLFDAKE